MQDTLPMLIWRYRKQMLIMVTAAVLVAVGLSLLLPKQYLSEASLLPVNSKMMDKQSLFGRSSVQDLNSAYGSSDDLDRITAIMHSAAVLHQVVDSLGLIAHYKIKGSDQRHKAMKRLDKSLTLKRSEYGDLQIKVWDKDPAMAKKIIEQLLKHTQNVFDKLYVEYYDRNIQLFQQELKRREQDSTQMNTLAGSENVQFIKDRINENRIARVNIPPAFFVLSTPVLAELPDKPRILLNIAAAVFAALLTMLFWLAAKSLLKSGYAKP
jgi:uncharacterized protein involved in exopolysaccharide biosynthesis